MQVQELTQIGNSNEPETKSDCNTSSKPTTVKPYSTNCLWNQCQKGKNCTRIKWSNNLPWCVLYTPILCRYKLIGLIDGTKPCASLFLANRSLNSDSEIWYEKNQNFLIWFNSTLLEEVTPFTVGVSSSRDLWLKLEQRFGGVSNAHIHQLQSRLQSIQKDSQSMSDYLQQLKEIYDSLTATGAFVSDRNLITSTLAKLLDDFE